MIIFSPSYGYSEFRRISFAVAMIKSIGIKITIRYGRDKPFLH